MPYQIQNLCSGSDNKCMEACPFDCIYVNQDKLSTKPPLYIDPDECTDCGACALACPESAIVPVVAYGRYAGLAAVSKVNHHESHVAVVQSESEADAFDVIANERAATVMASQS
jgi:NAD-dependent dihydropyrimidine dehydrogenase PreA subunit